MLLIDENLSHRLVSKLANAFPGLESVKTNNNLGEGATDNQVWQFAKNNNLAILTKDKDFVDYWKRFGPPPKVIKLQIGNCRFPHLLVHITNNQQRILNFMKNKDGILTIY